MFVLEVFQFDRKCPIFAALSSFFLRRQAGRQAGAVSRIPYKFQSILLFGLLSALSTAQP